CASARPVWRASGAVNLSGGPIMNSMQHYVRWLLGVAVLALGVASPVWAAGPGVTGRVLALDPKGLPTGNVPGAKIEFKNRGGKVAASASTDKNGHYKVNLPPGTYT